MSDNNISKEVLVVHNILKQMGIKCYDMQVIQRLMQFLYKYVTYVLNAANTMKKHAGRNILLIDDIKFITAEKGLYEHMQRDATLRLAKRFNRKRLKKSKKIYGLKIPPNQYSNVSANYRMKTREEIYFDQIYKRINHFNHLSALQQTIGMMGFRNPFIYNLPYMRGYHDANPFTSMTSVLKTSQIVRNQLSPFIKFNNT